MKVVRSALICTTLFATSWLILGLVAFALLFSLRIPLVEEMYSSGNTIYNYTVFSPCKRFNNHISKDYFLKEDSEHHFQEVYFNSRNSTTEENGLVHGYLLTHSNTSTRPAIVVVHGFRVSVKFWGPLIASNMLFLNGYDVLSISVRNHGKSFRTKSVTTTYGHAEHLDALGAFDFLNKMNSSRPIAISGASMGGATSLVAFAKEEGFKAAFLDSPVCDPVDLMTYHYGSIAEFLKPFIINGVYSVSKILPSLGTLPPFKDSPSEAASTIGNQRPIYFDHAISDTLVPLEHSKKCAKLASASGANVTEYYVDLKASEPDSSCPDHCLTSIDDSKDFEKRIVQFFKEHMPLE
ncbi:hypothetical protein AKO1_003212 [Acrasis kona]|uniref:AB hydrolase-1 domain-containing protein n=1 Tax=Acrasis kona TaxID=1008807 RepID=A0AAW2ZKQ0_9EUKA